MVVPDHGRRVIISAYKQERSWDCCYDPLERSEMVVSISCLKATGD